MTSIDPCDTVSADDYDLYDIFAIEESDKFPETSVGDQNSTLNDIESSDNRELEFTARPGTIDFGKKFEVNMTTLYAIKLCLSEDVTDFYIASNAKGYGAFDDILIRVEYKTGEKELFAIQLKHKFKDLTILKDDFNKFKSQFFLEKYQKSYENDVKNKFENPENKLTQGLSLANLVLCIFTNASIQQDTKLFNLDLQLNCKTLTYTEDDFISTKRNVHHKFHVNVLYPTFIEFVCQILQENFFDEITQIKSTNEKLLKSIDSGNLGNMIDSFQKQLRQRFLFGEINYKDAIKETIIAVDRSFQREDITSYIADFFQKEISMIAKVFDLNQRNADYTNYINELLQYKHKEELEEIRLANQDLFTDNTCEQIKGVVDYYLQTLQDQSQSSTQPPVNEIDENILRCIKWHFQYKYKKEKRNKYLEFFTKFRFYDGQFDHKEAEENISNLLKICFGEDLPHITKQMIEFIGEYFEQEKSILLTKRFVKMKLLELITGFNDEENYQIFENITSLQIDEQRSEILKTIRISLQGRETCSLQDLAETSFTKSLPSTYLLKNVGKVIQVGKRLNKKPENYLHRNVYKILLEERVLWETNDSIYLLDVNQEEYVNNKVYVTNKSPQAHSSLPFSSEKNIVILLGEYKVADYVSCLRKYFNSYRVHYLKLLENNLLEWKESWGSVEQLNNFIVESDIVEEEQMLKYFNRPLNIICAPLGTGKSTILDTLHGYCGRDDLILRMNLNEHRQIFVQDDTDFYQNPSNYICKIIQSTLTDDFECQLIRHLVEKKKVKLFIDGYDEITAEFSERVLKTLNDLQLTTWIATRSTAKSSIQNTFKIMTISVQPLSNEDSKLYLTQTTCLPSDEINEVLKTTELFQTPLHLTMLLEIINNNKHSLHGFKLRELYTSFIHLKYDLALKENKIKNSFLIAEGDDKFLNYKLMALCFVYSKEFLVKCGVVEEKEVDQLMNYFRKSQDPLSLINVMQTNVLNFSHTSYAEFLTALWLTENTQNKSFKTLYLQLVSTKYNAVRNIFDRLVCENDPLYLAVLDWNREKLTDMSGCPIKDKHGRTPLHIAVSYFKSCDVTTNECRTQTEVIGELVRILPEDCILEKDSLLEWDWWDYMVNSKNQHLMHAAAYWGQILILKLFKTKLTTRISNYINLTDKFEHTALYLASSNDQIACVIFLIKEKADVNPEKHRPILIASERGYLSVLETLVKAKCDVRQSDKSGRTALHFAASGGHTNCVQFLLSKGAKASASTHLFVSPLFVAACNGHAEVLNLLLRSKADPKVITFNGLTSLHISAINGYVECVKILHEVNAADINKKNRKGCTPLYLAAENGHLKVVEYLIDKNASVDETNLDHMTPLQIASRNGHLECVKHLIDKDANVNAEDNQKQTALFLASEFGHLEVIKILLDNNAIIDKANKCGWTALHAAASKGHTECLKILIHKHPDGVNAKEVNQCSSMHFSSNLGNVDALKLLLDNGAELDDYNTKRWTPLHFTALQGHVRGAEFLIQAGADKYSKTASGYTALHIAVQEGKTQVVQLLVDNKAGVNELNANGFTALHVAAKNGHIDSVRILINAGADVNFKIKDTYTPTYFAVRFGHLDVLKFLIDKGKVNIHEINKSGQSYLHTASAFRQLYVVKFLLKRKVDVEIIDFKEETALDVAMRIRHWECVELLQKYKKRWSYINLEEVAIQQKAELKTLLGNVTFLDMDEQKILRNMAAFGYAPLSASVAANCISITRSIMDQSVENQIKTIEQFTLLQIAAKNGHLNMLQWLLRKGANVNAVDNYGRTALFLASRMGFLQCTKLLINAGSDKNIASVKGYTSFLISAKFGHVDVTEALFDDHCLKMRTIHGKSGLILAASHGHLKTIKYLLKRNLNVDGEDEDSCTSLMAATKHGHLECVQYLVDNNANINRQNLLGDTALHIAAEEDNLDIIIFLISRNADPNIINRKGRTPDQVALKYRHGACSRFLVDSLHFWKISKQEREFLDTSEEVNVTNQRSLMEELIRNGFPLSCAAVYTGKLNVVKRFAKNNIHGRQSDKYRPLISAAERGYLDIIQWLVSEGVDVNTSNCHRKTALFKAARNGHLQCLRFLIAKGADVNFQSRKGSTSLLTSVKHNQFDVVKLLITKKANVGIRDFRGKSAVSLAAAKGHLSILKYLKMRGADINGPDCDGWTPVMLALSKGHPNCASFLIGKGCNLNGKNFDDGNTLLHVAALKDYSAIVKDLIEKGIDLHILNHKKESAVDVATGESATFLNHFVIKKHGLTQKMKKELISKGHQIDVNNFMTEWKNLVSSNSSTKLTPMYLAAAKGYSAILHSLIKYGMNVDEVDDKGRTALFPASRKNHLKCVEILLDKDANVNASDRNGCTPLLTASWFGNFEVFKTLLQNRAHLEVKDVLGRTPLMLAARNGHLEIVKYLMELKINFDERNTQGNTAVAYAAEYGNLECMRSLVKKCAAINNQDIDGDTPLHCAASRGHLDVIKVLMSKGADPTITNRSGKNPAAVACRYENEMCVKYLEDIGRLRQELQNYIQNELGTHPNCQEVLMTSLLQGHIDMVKDFVDNWRKARTSISTELIPLHVAVSNEQLMRLLIEKGANLDQVDALGRSALYLACIGNYFEGVKLLIELGSNRNLPNVTGSTPLHAAVQFSHFDIIKLLLTKEANLNAKDSFGRSVLMIAAKFGRLDVMKYLIGFGIDLNDVDKNGNNALAIASNHGFLNCVKLLVSKGIDLNSRDYDGDTPLHCAAFQGHQNIMQFLLSHGANSRIVNKNGETAGDVASRRGHKARVYNKFWKFLRWLFFRKFLESL